MRRKVLVFLIFAVLSALVVLEVYAHTYVPRLSITSREDIIDYLNRKYYFLNGTGVFQSCARSVLSVSIADWLVAWQFRKPLPSLNLFYFYLSKIRSEGGLFIQDQEIIPNRIETMSRGIHHENSVTAFLREVVYVANHTLVIAEYDVGAIDVYNATFVLYSRLYARTILGYLPIGETRMPINVTLDYRP